LNLDKKSIVYLTTINTFYNIEGIDDLHELIESCGQNVKVLIEKIISTSVANKFHQTSLF